MSRYKQTLQHKQARIQVKKHRNFAVDHCSTVIVGDESGIYIDAGDSI